MEKTPIQKVKEEIEKYKNDGHTLLSVDLFLRLLELELPTEESFCETFFDKGVDYYKAICSHKPTMEFAAHYSQYKTPQQ